MSTEADGQNHEVSIPEAGEPVLPPAGAGVPSRAGHAAACGAIALLSALVLLALFSPRFVLWRGLDIPAAWFNPEVNRAVDTIPRLDHPFAAVENPSNIAMQWRVLFPVIWHYLNLPVWSFLAMPHLGCLLALALIAHIALRRTGRFLTAFGVTLLSGTNAWFFVSTGWLAYFDSWFIIGLLVVSFVPSRLGLILATLLVPWVDERFVVALPLAVVVRLVYLRPLDERSARALRGDVLLAGAICALYATLRVSLNFFVPDANSGNYVGKTLYELRQVPIALFFRGLWSGWRAAWLFVIALPLLLLSTGRRGWALVTAAVALGTVFLGLVIAADISRSMGALLTAMLAGLLLLSRQRPAIFRAALPSILVANLVLPVSHVVWAFEVPLRTVWTEVHNWRNPPDFLQPSSYIEGAGKLLKLGRTKEALVALDVALRLDPTLVLTRLDRALLEATLGQDAAAASDVREARRLNPEDAGVLFVSGFVRRKAGDLQGADLDLTRALRVAPPDWPRRRQCETLQREVASALRDQESAGR